jgi:hypothetical protein
MSPGQHNLDGQPPRSLLPYNPIRAQNLALAAQAENPVVPMDTDGLSNAFFNFATGRLQIHPDEGQLMMLGDYIGRVVEWFEGLMRPPPPMATGIPGLQDTVFPHCNQITTLRPVLEFLDESKTFKLGKNNGTVKRLQRVLDLHANVVKAHGSCTSRLRKTLNLLPLVGKKNACFDWLSKALNETTSSGLFLRRYRDDIPENALEAEAAADDAIAGRVIDFRNPDQRTDYLNTNVSIFIEPVLRNAEMYFHTMLARQNVENQAAYQRRLNSSPPSDNGVRPPSRTSRVASAVAKTAKRAYNGVQGFRNRPIGKLIGLVEADYSSPDTPNSPSKGQDVRRVRSYGSYGSKKSPATRKVRVHSY